MSPIELSARALAEASTTKDSHERCRLLLDATILDPSSIEAQLARAESRCAIASELLPNAHAAFAARKDQRSAEVLAAVAERAGSDVELKAAAEVLATLDVTSRLAAARIYAKGDPARAATLFDEIAAAREAKGATVDALDARLDAAMARADAGKPSGLAAMIEPAAAAAKSYGAAWIAPKVIEALAAARVAGESAAALAAQGEKLGLFAGVADAFAIERAIALGKDVPAVVARVNDPAVRALLVANAKDCASASAHARAHRRLPADGLVLARDVARSLKRACPNGEVAGRPTLVLPVLTAELADVVEVGRAEPLHARARLEQLRKMSPNDPAVRYAQFLVTKDMGALEGEPSFAALRLAAASGAERTKLAVDYVNNVLPSTIEATVPRGLAQALADALALEPSDDIAASLLSTCAVGATGACVKDLSSATSRLRQRRTALLATKGALLAKEDLSPLVRLDLIVALIDQKKLPVALKLRAGNGPEASLGDALITATNGNCAVAKAAMTKATTLRDTHSDVFARIAKVCAA